MAESLGTIGDALAHQRRVRFVGREPELELVRAAFDGAQQQCRVVYVHGPAGIGKSTLLDRIAEMAVAAKADVVRHVPDAGPPSQAELAAAIRRGADDRPARRVVLIDLYERLSRLDDWIRDDLLPSLPMSTLIVIAGRRPPSAGWRADPAWRGLLHVISLRNLSRGESRQYLDLHGIDSTRHDQLYEIAHGHPLGLSLVADVVARGGEVAAGGRATALPPDVVGALVRRFVDVTPTDIQRRALGACALARVTSEALLRDVVGEGDAAELFDWLRELSFVESGPDGLYPHELARDVLDVELRWRDPDGYKVTFRRVRDHVHRRLVGSHGREQQRAIFDEKYLFRNVPSTHAPIDWSVWGQHYPERADAGDHDQIVDLVRGWEGQEAAEIAERWLALQPDGFFVLRRQDGSVGGVIGLIELTTASAEALATDPGAQAAWQFVQRHRPARAGEVVELTRFVIDRDAYQGPSPTINATPILAIQRCLEQPNLAWGLLTVSEPERWDRYFAATDLPRVAGADFVVGGHRFGLFAHDFRQVPVDAWLELVTERALARDATMPPRRRVESLVLSKEDFDDAVRQALRHLHRPDLLARNPLLRSRVLRDRVTDREPDALDLEALLSDSLDVLRANARDDKMFRAVEQTYVRSATTQEAAAEALGVPFSTYRRHLFRGIERVTARLWDLEVYGTEHR
ncbi:MAG TPA: AAA family ATPase [Jiangellaceae bacterium]